MVVIPYFESILNPCSSNRLDQVNEVSYVKPSILISIGILFSFFGIVATSILLHLQLAHVVHLPWYVVWIPIMAVTIPCFFQPLCKHLLKEVNSIRKYTSASFFKLASLYILVLAPVALFCLFIAAIIIRQYIGERLPYIVIFLPAHLICFELVYVALLDQKLQKSSRYCFNFCAILMLFFSFFALGRFELGEPLDFPWTYVFLPLYIGEVSITADAFFRFFNTTEGRGCGPYIIREAVLPMIAKFSMVFTSSITLVFLTLYLDYGTITVNELFISLYVTECIVIICFSVLCFTKNKAAIQSIN